MRARAKTTENPLARRVAELEAALEREHAISVALRDVTAALGATQDLDVLLELILEKLKQLLHADRATLYLLDDARGELVSRFTVGSEVRSIRLAVGEGIAGTVARSGKPLRVRDAYRDRRFHNEWDRVTGYRTRSIVAAPLKNHLGRIIGVVQVLNKRGGVPFTADDESLLASFATQASVSIDNSRLFLAVIQKNLQLLETKGELERRVRDLHLLFQLESAMARASTHDDLVRAALVEAARACEARCGAMLLGDEGADDATLYYVEAHDDAEVRHLPMKSGEGLVGWAMRENAPLRVEDTTADPRSSLAAERALGIRTSTAVAVPLEGELGAPIGAVALYDRRGGQRFGDEDEGLLRLVAANMSTAIRLYRARQAREREERLSAIGKLLSGVLHDMKTPMAVVHGYVQEMAKAKGAPERQELARKAKGQFESIYAMQREVLEFARGERSLFLRRVYLGKFFPELVEQLGALTRGTKIELSLELADRGTARFDEGKIARVVHNLVRNAIEAIGARRGRVVVGVRRHAAKVPEIVITVADDGPGIPREVERRLFQTFVTAGKKGGTGLGLAVVRKIVDEHCGRVSVVTGPSGTTFEVRIPQHEAKS